MIFICFHSLGNAHYSSRNASSKNNKSLNIGQDFLIKHYAGDVVYNINGFIEKNRDTLFQDFKRLLYHSKNPIFQSMWPEGAHDINKITKRPLTAGTLFKNSMNELMKILASKEPFYVRCIKPNELKSPSQMNKDRVVHQISYLGLLENVRVRRAGFAYRYINSLLDRIELCLPEFANFSSIFCFVLDKITNCSYNVTKCSLREHGQTTEDPNKME